MNVFHSLVTRRVPYRVVKVGFHVNVCAYIDGFLGVVEEMHKSSSAKWSQDLNAETEPRIT